MFQILAYILSHFSAANTLSEKILSYWENDFKSSFEKHLSFLNKNIENQEVYNSKFSEILQEMEIFDSENDDEKQENKENEKQKEIHRREYANYSTLKGYQPHEMFFYTVCNVPRCEYCYHS